MKRTFIIMAVLVSLSLVSCGGGGGPSTTIDVTLTDFQFQPSQFTVPAGQTITFNSSNNGAVVHNFVIMNLGTSAGDSFDEEDVPNVYWETELQPGGSTTTTFTAPSAPGEYQVMSPTQGNIVSRITARSIVVPAGE